MESIRYRKLFAVTILMLGWLAMGFGAFTDQWDSITIYTVITGIFAEDGGNDGLDKTKPSFLHDTSATFGCGTNADKVIVMNLLKELLSIPSIPRYKMVCVYRL
jgi:hypothetical protein